MKCNEEATVPRCGQNLQLSKVSRDWSDRNIKTVAMETNISITMELSEAEKWIGSINSFWYKCFSRRMHRAKGQD